MTKTLQLVAMSAFLAFALSSCCSLSDIPSHIIDPLDRGSMFDDPCYPKYQHHYHDGKTGHYHE
ncbi:MAG: hypothetical protein AAF236_02645 [Verrucomicrobiota bacterium]